MKILTIQGGLGNQMFQYAFYLALKNRGVKVKINTSLYSQIEMHNGYELERCFNVKEKAINNKIFSLLTRFVLKLNLNGLLYNDKLYFERNVFLTRSIFLNGYWQSENYFKNIKDKIQESFIFKNIDEYNKQIAEEMNSCMSVALHIRRGDYVNNSYYYDLSHSDFYQKAVKYITSELKHEFDITFYIFSNDERFANEFIRDQNIVNAKIINHNRGVNSYKDMFLMSKCKHNIIANSSFSWWGAYLNSNPEKKVISPEKWFNERNKVNSKDLIPEKWMKI